jgi:hypothetical protein
VTQCRNGACATADVAAADGTFWTRSVTNRHHAFDGISAHWPSSLRDRVLQLSKIKKHVSLAVNWIHARLVMLPILVALYSVPNNQLKT